jgi:hypothetical protein
LGFKANENKNITRNSNAQCAMRNAQCARAAEWNGLFFIKKRTRTHKHDAGSMGQVKILMGDECTLRVVMLVR